MKRMDENMGNETELTREGKLVRTGKRKMARKLRKEQTMMRA
jgi:hypothetical protein